MFRIFVSRGLKDVLDSFGIGNEQISLLRRSLQPNSWNISKTTHANWSSNPHDTTIQSYPFEVELYNYKDRIKISPTDLPLRRDTATSLVKHLIL